MQSKKNRIFLITAMLFVVPLAATDDGDDLIDAAEEGDIKTVRTLLKQGIDLNAKSMFGYTALHKATQMNHLKVVKLLLQGKANIHAKNWLGKTPLHLATTEGHLHIVKLLLQCGADVNDKSHSGKNALQQAVLGDHPQVVKLLLQCKVNLNVKDPDGSGLLHVPAWHGEKRKYYETAKILIKNGTDMNAKDKKNATPLHDAAMRGSTKIAELFLQHGADANARDVNGNTPLHTAVEVIEHYGWSRDKMICLLWLYGANIHTKNKNGKTPLELTKFYETRELLSDPEKLHEGAHPFRKNIYKKLTKHNTHNKSIATHLRNRELGYKPPLRKKVKAPALSKSHKNKISAILPEKILTSIEL